ncbi:hypothetical protein OC844_006644 [Tilletia horrida]|nr:hypothetical protein OC844_006644 [Tilletia horrida]
MPYSPYSSALSTSGCRLKIGKAHDQLEALGFYYVVVLGPFALSLPSSPTSCFASALSPLVALSLPSNPTSCFASAVSPLATLETQVRLSSRRNDVHSRSSSSRFSTR